MSESENTEAMAHPIFSNYPENPEESVAQCSQLLDNPQLESAVRAGDVLALLIEHYAQLGHFTQVRACTHTTPAL